MTNELTPLLPNCVYHICTHAITHNNFFTETGNYLFFLEKYEKFISPIADTYAYCLMPNHFHLVIKMKTEDALMAYFDNKTAEVSIPHLLSYQFSHFFNAYTKSFNKLYGRRGSLFERSFKRYLVTDRTYFKTVILYTLANPVRHGFTHDFKDWSFSAYWTLVFDEQPTFLKRDIVFNVFNGKDKFKEELGFYAQSKNKDWFE